ncbi:hypothetical protein [Aliirhizobium smilacinae]|uniref:Uncharacterized protein n=1 Tax=Aliirhizobium smilacinae TaxID=1395944 RepID=A0A5C4X7N8_9HYPH|nr:hypothetical protein [Rhizobium smilacinae]TNM59426.1 hypothetical protein FHP24_28450 [Rhizobium smilacinae]
MSSKKSREIDKIADTIRDLATPDIKPKALIDAVRELHPDASKKDIARAAFLRAILSAEFKPEDTQALHDIASETRNEDSD